MRTYDTAYPGSMIERKNGDGDYIAKDDAPSLAAALLLISTKLANKVEDQADEIQALRAELREIEFAPHGRID